MEECTCFFAVWRILPSSEVSPDTQPSTPSTPKKKKKKAKVFGEKFLPGMISTQERKTYIGGFKTTPKNPSLWKVAQKKAKKANQGWMKFNLCMCRWLAQCERAAASKFCIKVVFLHLSVWSWSRGWLGVGGRQWSEREMFFHGKRKSFLCVAGLAWFGFVNADGCFSISLVLCANWCELLLNECFFGEIFWGVRKA